MLTSAYKDLSSVGGNPNTDTGVVWVAMFSMLYHNWSGLGTVYEITLFDCVAWTDIVLPSQPLPNMVQDLGPRAYRASESPSPSPPTPPNNSLSLPMQDDKSKRERSLVKYHDDDTFPVCKIYITVPPSKDLVMPLSTLLSLPLRNCNTYPCT